MRQWLRARWRILAVIVTACFAVAYVAQWQFSLFWKDPIRDRAMFPKTFNAYESSGVKRVKTFHTEGCQRSMVGRPVLELMGRNPRAEAERDFAMGRLTLFADDVVMSTTAKLRTNGVECLSRTQNGITVQLRFWPDITGEYKSLQEAKRFGKDAYYPPDFNCTSLYKSLVASFEDSYNRYSVLLHGESQKLPCSEIIRKIDYNAQQDWPW
jgi:hypothetical protein